MKKQTFTLSQKDLQRVEVISQCAQGDLACVEPRSCSLYHRDTSNASKPVIGKAVQRLRHTPASFAGAQVQLCQSFDGRVSLYYRDTRLQHTIRGGHLYGAVTGDKFTLLQHGSGAVLGHQECAAIGRCQTIQSVAHFRALNAFYRHLSVPKNAIPHPKAPV